MRADRAWVGEQEGHPKQAARYPSVQPGRRRVGGGGKLQRVHHARTQGREGYTLTGQRTTPAYSQGEEEDRNPPEPQRAHLAHNMQEREGGIPHEPEVDRGEPSNQRAQPAHSYQER